MPQLGRVDVAAYGRSFVLLARYPQVVLAPLLAAVVQVLLVMIFPGDGGGIGNANAGLASLISQFVGYYGFCVALIVASLAWRGGRASFDEAWDDARRKAGEIVFASLGFSFVLSLAAIAGSFLPIVGPLVVELVAYYFFIYTLPAAAIGGIPGGAALNSSLERARRDPLPTLVVTLAFVFGTAYMPSLILQLLAPLLIATPLFASNVASAILIATIKALVAGYLAFVLAKTYDDVSYGRSFR